LKNLEFVCHDPELFCGIVKRDWSNDEANYHLLGVPLDISSTYRTGARYGPDYFRKTLSSENFECTSENGLPLNEYYKIKDWGNVGIINTDLQKSIQLVSEGVYDIIETEKPFLIIGGDHSTTTCIGKAYEKADIPIHYIYIDAHLDLYDEVKGSKLSHACTLRRISELTSFHGASVFGYRDFTKDQLKYAENSNINIFSTNDLLSELSLLKFGYKYTKNLNDHVSRIHVSIDLDVLDPSFAPGVGNPVAAGITTRDLIRFLKGLFKGIKDNQLISWDIVEFNPLYDNAEITAFSIVKILIESLGSQILV